MLRYGSRRWLARVPSEAGGAAAVDASPSSEGGAAATEAPSTFEPGSGTLSAVYETLAREPRSHGVDVASYEAYLRDPEMMRIQSSTRGYKLLESLYPLDQGYRTTEDYFYAWAPYPEAVLRAKEELLHRTGGMPKSGEINRLGPEHNSERQKAIHNLTEEGVRAFNRKLLYAAQTSETAAISEDMAVKEVLAGRAGCPETTKQDARKSMEEYTKTSDPFHKAGDPDLLQTAGSAVSAETLFKDEGLVLDGASGNVAARRELLKTTLSAHSIAANPLRFFMHSSAAMRSRRGRKAEEARRQKTQFATRTSWLEAEKEKERERMAWKHRRQAEAAAAESELREIDSIRDEDIDSIFDDDEPVAAKIKASESQDASPASPPPQPLQPKIKLATRDESAPPSTVPTPEALKAHTMRMEERQREKKAALRLKNIRDLNTPKPMYSGSVIPGGGAREEAALRAMMNEFVGSKQDPESGTKAAVRPIEPEAKPRAPEVSPELLEAARAEIDPMAGLDPFEHDPVTLRTFIERSLDTVADAIDTSFVRFCEGKAAEATEQLSRLSSALGDWTQDDLAGSGLVLPRLHQWHVHCVKLLCQGRVERHTYNLACQIRDTNTAKMRLAVVQHNDAKLEKLTASLGSKFYDNFWAAAKPFEEEKRDRRDALNQKLLGCGNQQVVMSLAIQKDPVVATIREDYSRFLSEVCRVAREFDAAQSWAALDTYMNNFIYNHISLSHDKRHQSLRSSFIADPRPLIDAWENFARAIVQFNWSGALMRRAQLTRSEEVSSAACQNRKESLERIFSSLTALQNFGTIAESPMRQEYYVAPDAEGLDGSEKESRGNIPDAMALYQRPRRGLVGDRRDMMACIIREYDLETADKLMVQMMRDLELTPAAAILGWEARSKGHRAALWHRYMADLNMWLGRVWLGYQCYRRAPLIVTHCLQNAQHHFEQAQKINLLPTEQTAADRCVTAALEAHLLHNALYQKPCESYETFGFSPLDWEEAIAQGAAGVLSVEALERKQQGALALFKVEEDSSVDDNPWVGYGSGVRWFIILSCDDVQREVNVGTGYSTDGSSGDLDVWYACYRRLEALLGEAEEGCEKAYVSARLALHMNLRPCFSVAERNAVMDHATAMAMVYVTWLAKKASKRVILDQRSLWMNVVSLAFWGTFRQGRAAREALPGVLEQIVANQGQHMRYFDVGTLSNVKTWLEDYIAEPKDDEKWLKQVFVGTGRMYLSQPVFSLKQRWDFEAEHYEGEGADALRASQV